MSKWSKAQEYTVYDKRASSLQELTLTLIRSLTSLQGSRITVLHDEISHSGLGVGLPLWLCLGFGL